MLRFISWNNQGGAAAICNLVRLDEMQIAAPFSKKKWGNLNWQSEVGGNLGVTWNENLEVNSTSIIIQPSE